MGTEIHLELGGLALSWAKNHCGPDHGALFQEGDRRAVRSDQIDYAYFQEENEDPTPMEMAFVRKLKQIVPRLDLLGFTLEQARSVYDHWAVQWKEEREANADSEGSPIPEPLSFKEYCTFANRQSVTELDDTFHDDNASLMSRTKCKGRFIDDEATLERIPCSFDHDDQYWSERSYFGSRINILHPYLMLRILAGNAVNLETDVVWQYGPLVEAGWATAAEFMPLARRTETFLIATEGSSDAHILRHGFELLRPEVADFFRFIDVSDRHPFPGTGNLLKFAEGLAKIDVHNQTIFVFDNDAEGAEAFNKLGALVLPSNLRAMLLPSLDAFRSFPAKGPQGDHEADINGRAAAIECYLDHRLKDYPPPRVIWTNYKKEADTYQGALEYKEAYTKAFLKLTPDKLAATGYDTGNIEKVLDALIEQCIIMASGELAARLAASDS
ncbi:HEPN/Toprim-associated domain-containing protein [Magnetospirillum sp. SS-4]|uniref:HEPN/Toprim-associated domain-containing protein n=1 Tax=Magnetospirillum sp. SS-4 TaxID=2681465 RepID=UPI001383D0A5|nr:HEPN/Toprim-associated domain-containing protein [Magnetospirillum sp. SS-4]CAA7616138.1 conserved hypothetical protein [Magnetospirillum sp. SS-4]